jgi:DNA-binding beta-propeller fold protein YncE
MVLVSACGGAGVKDASRAGAGEAGKSADASRDAPRAVAHIAVGGAVHLAVGQAAVWVTDDQNERLVRIDPKENAVVGSIPLPGRPSGVAVGHDSVWVSGRDEKGGFVVEIDPHSSAIRGEPVRVGNVPGDLAVGSNSVWVTNAGQGTSGGVWRIDPTEHVVLDKPISVGVEPVGLAFGDGYVWVAVGDGTVVRIDPRSHAIEGEPIYTGVGSFDLAIGEHAIWVISDEGLVTRIDRATHELIERIRVGGVLSGVAVGHRYVWVTSAQQNELTRIDPMTNTVVGSPLAVNGGPFDVAIGDGAVWVTNNFNGSVTKIAP